MSKRHTLTADEISQLLPASELDEMAKALGLSQCLFSPYLGDCDSCAVPIGRLWCAVSGYENEVSYYVCDACLPDKFIDTALEWSGYSELMECFACTGQDREARLYERMEGATDTRCKLCYDLGVIFRSIRPHGQRERARERFTVAANRAHYTTGRRRKKWRRIMSKWHRIAVRECQEQKPRETRSKLSLRLCDYCAVPFRAVWIDRKRGYAKLCSDCTADFYGATIKRISRIFGLPVPSETL